MKIRLIAAAVLAVALAAAASTASGGTKSAKATTLTVWLQDDAKNGWADAVAAATRAFQAKHPGVDVDVQYQQWTTHLTKFDAALAANNAPDVIEMGNTETTKYMAAGAFASLQAKSFPNSKRWLSALKGSCTYGGKLYCVPYYAGARAVIYRKDYYRAAGIKGTPRTLAGFVAAGRKLMKKFGKDRDFSAFYFAGKNWYASMQFVYDYGGQIAVRKNGKWKGTLNSPQAVKALTVLKGIVRTLSRAPLTTDEAHPWPSIPFAKGKIASFIGNGWEWPYTLDAKVGNPSLAPVMGAYPMPSHIKGRYMPTFLGGSDLAVPVTSKNKSLARDWIAAFTSSSSERVIAAAGNIPNATSLASFTRGNPKVEPFAEAAKFSWFVPTSPNWVNVENADVLQNMLVQIFSGRRSVKAATTNASNQITRILNTGS
jgi:N,N'-diacetylchitobiose transport system substrate-binding protein